MHFFTEPILCRIGACWSAELAPIQHCPFSKSLATSHMVVGDVLSTRTLVQCEMSRWTTRWTSATLDRAGRKMLRRAASRACGTLATRLQHKGSLLENGFQYRSFYTLRQGTRPFFSASSSHGLPDPPPGRTLTQLYLYMLAKYPLVTKSVTASAIYAVGDIACQGIVRYRVTEHPEEAPWDVKKTMEAAAIGFFVGGPTAHFWFNFASKVVPATNLIGTLKKMAMEQLILAPISAGTFLAISVFWKGKSLDEILSQLQPHYPIMLRSELFYWPACSFITYRHVPVHLQPLARNSMFLVWSIYFTYMACSTGIEVVLGSV